MKKRNKSNPLPSLGQQNPVAKYARKFNKAHIFKDKTRYQRHNKHKGQEPLTIRDQVQPPDHSPKRQPLIRLL